MKLHLISKTPNCFLFTPIQCRGFLRSFHYGTGPLCTHYKTLDIKEDANEQEIRQAYLNMCKKYHPDVNKTQDAEAKFREVRAAYEVLSNRGLRQKYDAKERWSRPRPRPRPMPMYDTDWEERKAPYKDGSKNLGREWNSFNRYETGKDSEFKFEERYYRFDDDKQKFRDEVFEALRKNRAAQRQNYRVWEDVVYWAFPQRSRVIYQRGGTRPRSFRRWIWFGLSLIFLSYLKDSYLYLHYEDDASRKYWAQLEESERARREF